MQPDTAVWIRSTLPDEAFELATVKESLGESSYSVLTSAGAEKLLRAAECSLANPDEVVAADACQLVHISESTILANLRKRFVSDRIYTFTGSILQAVNPFCELPLYGEAQMEAFVDKPLNAQEPHAYAMAEEAFRRLRSTQRPQSLSIGGESGAGKTETNKHCMRYLLWRARTRTGGDAAAAGPADGGEQDLAHAILQSNLALEAFGNAATARNRNSSRFAKFTQLFFTPAGAVVGAATRQFLLEKSRVVGAATALHGARERSYHAFYQLVGAAALPELQPLSLGGVESFGCLACALAAAPAGGQDGGAEAAAAAAEAEAEAEAEARPSHGSWEETSAALAAVGVSAAELDGARRLLGGILHLSNVEFAEEGGGGEGGSEGDGGAASVRDDARAALALAASQLGLAGLEASVVSRRIVTRGEEVVVRLLPAQARLARASLAKAVYTRLFEWVVASTNRRLAGSAEGGSGGDGGGVGGGVGGGAALFIGLLDIFGFESFEHNSFEQLCINYANEKLQQLFLKFVFQAEQALYAAEQLPWRRIEYAENRGCLELLEGSPCGVLRLLDEAGKKPAATDASFCEAVGSTHRRHDFFLEARLAGHRQVRPHEGFVVRHYAGDVCYEGRGWLEKNADALHPDLRAQLAASAHPLLAAAFGAGSTAADGAAAARPSGRGAAFSSVARRFTADLSLLAQEIELTHAHFVQCLKPNASLRPREWSAPMVLSQLRCLGAVEVVRLLAASYPSRIPYHELYQRHAPQLPQLAALTIRGCRYPLEPRLFAETLVKALGVSADLHLFGATRLFLRPAAGALFARIGHEDGADAMTPAIEAALAGGAVQAWARELKASLTLQARGRTHLAASRFRAACAAVLRLQRVWRGWRARRAVARRAALLALAQAEEEAARKKAAAELDAMRAALVAAEAAEEEAHREAEAAEAARTEAGRAAAELAAARAAVEAEMEVVAVDPGPGRGLLKQRSSARLAVALRRSAEAAAQAEAAASSAAGVAAAAETAWAAEPIKARHGAVGRAARAPPAPAPAAAAASAATDVGGGDEPASTLLSSRLTMLDAATFRWQQFDLELRSDGALAFCKTQPPACDGRIDLTASREVSLISITAADGGGSGGGGGETLAIVNPDRTHYVRGLRGDVAALRDWRRALYRLLPHLQPYEVRAGWLQKYNHDSGGGGGAASTRFGGGLRRRYAVLYSSHRLVYFYSAARLRPKGSIDLRVAVEVRPLEHERRSSSGGGGGSRRSCGGRARAGFEVVTAGRTWVFALGPEAEAELPGWMEALQASLREAAAERDEDARDGVATVKEGWARLWDSQLGAWSARWFVLDSTQMLTIALEPDARRSSVGGHSGRRSRSSSSSDRSGGAAAAEQQRVVVVVHMATVARVERSRGVDYYEYGLDLLGPEGHVRMRAPDRAEMQTWLGVLRMAQRGRGRLSESIGAAVADAPTVGRSSLVELSAFSVAPPPPMTTTLQSGWLELSEADAPGSSAAGGSTGDMAAGAAASSGKRAGGPAGAARATSSGEGAFRVPMALGWLRDAVPPPPPAEAFLSMRRGYSSIASISAGAAPEWRRYFFVLVSQQAVDHLDDAEVRYFLAFYDDEGAAAVGGEANGVLDLSDVQKVRRRGGLELVLACEAHAWRLRMPSPPSHEAWCTSLRHFCPAAVTERTHARVARHASREVMRETFV